MSTATTARSVIKDVATSSSAANSARTAFPKQRKLFHFTYQRNPTPINSTAHVWTRVIASDPYHPLYIRTQRRLAAFDADKFHWAVKAPKDLSRKVVVRNWAVRRVRDAFREELRAAGHGRDVELVAREDGSVDRGKKSLKGALCIILDKNRAVVTAASDEVRKECAWLVRKVEQLQDERQDAKRR